MTHVLNEADFASARAIEDAKLGELGFVPVCMAPGEAAPGHSHTLVEEIVIVKKGMGRIQIDNEYTDLCAGSVALIPAGKFHALCNIGKEDLEASIVFNSNVDKRKVVLKNREEHFADCEPTTEELAAELAILRKENKKLKKRLKKA